MKSPDLSIIIPAYNESQNLPVLYDRICKTLAPFDLDWELIIVDDHSKDSTYFVAADFSKKDPRVQALRFSRNCGSHVAIVCGLRHAAGDSAVVLAADLQDPPEMIPQLVTEWKAGAHVVWAARSRREGESASTLFFSRLYYFLMKRLVGMKDMPAQGADFFLIDRRVINALSQFNESNVSIMALINWMGFVQKTLMYDKKARLHGRSGWSLEKKFKLVWDSVTSFTYLPIRLMSSVGFVVAMLGIVYACVVITNVLIGNAVPGWTSLMVVILVIGGVQMIMTGILGEYLWRAFDEARARPRYLIEASTDNLRLKNTVPANS